MEVVLGLGVAFKTGHYIAIEEALCGPSHLGDIGKEELFSQDLPFWLDASPSLRKLGFGWGLSMLLGWIDLVWMMILLCGTISMDTRLLYGYRAAP